MRGSTVLRVILGLNLTAFAAISDSSAQDTKKKIEPLALGASAPDFSLPGVDGKNYSLKSFADAEILVVVFTCNHCPAAQGYEERIKQLTADYKEKGVAVVAISPNDPLAVRLDELGYTDLSDSFEEGKIRAKDHKFNFQYLYDGDSQAVSKAYGPRATPHVFIFDKQRKLRYQGGVDDSERLKRVKKHHIRNALDALLAGKPVEVTVTPTFGCSIKWSDKRGTVTTFMENLAAEEIGLETIDGDGIRKLLKNDSGKLRLINIWATWCPPCRAEFPELVTINRMYRKRDFEMITISIDKPDQRGTVLEFLKQHQASNRNTLFNSTDLNQVVEATNKEWMGAVPLTLLVLPGGEIAYKQLGEIEALETKRAIVEILGRTY